jgi:hypothetical protein
MALKRVFAAMTCLLTAGLAMAADNALLIQVEAGGGYRVWHTEGSSRLTEDEILMLSASASPSGSEPQQVSAGRARAFQTGNGVVIELPEAATDRRLLVDRDACGAIKVWHAEGETKLTDDQITELVISALPGGGRLIKIDGRYAKAFITELGYSVVLWQPAKR